MKTRYLILMATVVLYGTNAYAACTNNQTCGRNCCWDLTDGTLTISTDDKTKSGTIRDSVFVKLPDGHYGYKAPWYSQKDSITSVVVEGNTYDTDGNVTKQGITSVGEHAFSGTTGLTSVDLSGVQSIGHSAFSGATGLTSVDLSGVQSIGSYAFLDATNLTSVTISDSVTSIESSAFSGTQLTQDDLADVNPSVLLHNSALQGMKNLTSFTIPEGTTQIPAAAFIGTGITSITIPDSVTSIGNSAFSYTKNLTSVTIPDSVTSIEAYAFEGSAVTTVDIPSSVTIIGDKAFWNSNLTSVTIPDSVTSIGNCAFQGLTNLKEITLRPDQLLATCSSCMYGNTIFGSSKNQTGVKINCKGEVHECDEILKSNNVIGYSLAAELYSKKQADGSTAFYKDGKIVAYRGKRIYTVDEASAVAGKTNTFRIRYR